MATEVNWLVEPLSFHSSKLNLIQDISSSELIGILYKNNLANYTEIMEKLLSRTSVPIDFSAAGFPKFLV